MSFDGLLARLARQPEFAAVIDAATAGSLTSDIGMPLAARGWASALASHPQFGGRPLLLVTSTTREAESLATEVAATVPMVRVAVFPAWETLPHERLSPTHDTVGRRVALLHDLRHADSLEPHNRPSVVVASVRAVLQPLVGGLGENLPLSVNSGDDYPLEGLVADLVGRGYDRATVVSRRGEFAVRGGIVDVFVPTDDYPTRIELFGDTVDDLRLFGVADQRTLTGEEAKRTAVTIPQCRELLLTDSVRSRARSLLSTHSHLADILEPLSEGIYQEGMESLAPLLADGMESILDVTESRRAVIVCDPERIRTRAEQLTNTSAEFLAAGWNAATGADSAPIDLGAASYLTLAELAEQAAARSQPWWQWNALGGGPEVAVGVDDHSTTQGDHSAELDEISLDHLRPLPPTRGHLEDTVSLVRERLAGGYAVVVMTAGAGSAERFVERFGEEDIPVQRVRDLSEPLPAGVVTVTHAPIQSGLDAPAVRTIVITEADVRGSSATRRSELAPMPSKRRRTIDLMDLRPGDYVVHEQHGVGRFVELQARDVGGVTREYVVIEYAPGKRGHPPDRLLVPADQLDQITKYVGGESPSLHKLGGSDWTQTKARARKAVRQIAGELVRLYAARQSAEGYAFGPDTPWQRELEDAFAHVETPDQLACIHEVKSDMEKTVPMDRIVCGDVGYGKTEIAVRAAFKAVQDGKQVAVLVPTTLLVRQHSQTFSERFAQFPVNVRALSRFQSAREADDVRAGLADGSVDVVIATHRILGPTTVFKDLGLVIVDEEQRFGVEHKEHLKALRTNVDVLTMSATPIPRTLEMAVTGIREMSTIQTPPEQRLPVLTYVGPYEQKQVAAAIRRELLREGQAFYIHNRVSSIDRAAKALHDAVPEARIAVAHGQMSESALEAVIDKFWQREVDVLVCTTIVENGLDISNANTLIVDRADQLGLSQMHQLRGRVGRSSERAYAYFFYPGDRTLTETAHDRLETIAQHTSLGSGMAVAMKDLEIRGAGNLLGGEQAGHIADVGFDLYVRLVGEALNEFTGDGSDAPVEVNLELPVNAHIPSSFVAEEQLRIEAYQRFASAHDSEAIAAVTEELTDRYGPLPEPVQLLPQMAALRNRARAAGVSEIATMGSRVRLAPVELPESRSLRLARLYPGSQYRPATRTVLVPAPTTGGVVGKPLVDGALIAWLNELFDQIVAPSSVARPESSATTVSQEG